MSHHSKIIAARNIVIFLAALASVQWLVDRVASPFLGADKVEKKFAYFAAHKDEFDVIFVGSSRVMNQVSPRVFDQAMAKAGHPCRSINLGYAGMFLPESAFLVNRIRKLHPARLQTILVELSTHTPRRNEEAVLTAREIYWHRSVETALVCANVLTDPSPNFSTGERLEQIGRQFSIFTRCLVHLGSGPDLFEHFQNASRRPSSASDPGREILGPDLDGFSPLQTTLGQGTSAAFKTGGDATDLANYQASVAALRADVKSLPRPVLPSTPGADFGETIIREILARQASSLRADGIRPVYFIGPVTTRESAFLELAAQGAIPRLLAFNDPIAYPELYRPEVRADRYHLNIRGAEILTRLLARRLVEPMVAKPDAASE